MIVIYGASGHTGTLIAQALQEQGLDFAMAGRNESRLQRAADSASIHTPDLRVARIDQPNALRELFADADVVINCAGPFGQIGHLVIEAALDADAHYLDITGEQEYVRSCYETFESAARHAGRVIVNACAFEVALGDWAAHLAAQALEVDTVDSLSICYAIDRLSPTKGTQLSILEALGKQGFRWDEGRWIRVTPGSDRIEMEYPQPFGPRLALSFPSAEVITVPRHVQVNQLQTYMSIGQDTPAIRAASMIAPVVSPFLSPLLGPLLRSSLGSIAESTIRSADPTAPIDSGRFAIVAQATARQRSARCALSGEDIYAVTAGIVALFAERLQNEGSLSGVLTPSELLDPKDALEEIAEQYKFFLELP